ncbi:MAG: YciI family protein [Gemmatimonadota bacterium]|nr:YciI family protein [Gemmatimonadota bacterium]
MKKFMLLHFGFERPTPEIMEAWGRWFESIADKQVDQGGFSGGREISKAGTKDLPWGMESITGYNIIEAEDLDAAGRIARENPYIASIRVYEIRSM